MQYLEVEATSLNIYLNSSHVTEKIEAHKQSVIGLLAAIWLR